MADLDLFQNRGPDSVEASRHHGTSGDINGGNGESPERGEKGAGRGDMGASHVSPWEWVTGAVSLLTVLAVIGFLGLQAARSSADPPLIELSVDTMIVAGSGYLVEFTARNTGDRTASQLKVEGVLPLGPAEPERSEATIQYVPAGGQRQAGLFFTRDPRGAGLELRPIGYEDP